MFQVCLLTLMLLTQTMVKGSPCSLVLHYVNCERQRVDKIPQHFPDSITILDLNYNLLQSLGPGDLQRYTALDTLLINHNQLKEVGVKAFLHLTELSYLDLSYNNLKHISNGIFRNNTKLTEVFLSGNKFRLDNASPFLISSSITNLELRDCSIRQIESVTFTEMEELNYLDLLKNKVMDLDPATFRSTELRDLYIDSTSGIESTLTKLCQNGIFVHFMMGDRLIDFCKTNPTFRILPAIDAIPVRQEGMTTFENNTLSTSKSSSFVIVTSPASSLSSMEATTSLHETEPTLKETLSNLPSNVTVYLSSPVVSDVKTIISELEINNNEKSLEMSEFGRKIVTKVNNSPTISFDSELLIFIVFVLLILCSSLTLIQWLHYSRKLQNNNRNVSQYALQIITSRAPTYKVHEYLVQTDDEDSLIDGYEVTRRQPLTNVQPVPQLVWPSGWAPERPLPTPPSPSRWSLVSNHEYDKLQHS